MGSVLDLKRYYQDEVLGLRQRLWSETTETTSAGPSNPASNNPGLAFDGGDNIPEIHFPSSEESLDHSTPQMETGMQMLQSLEQGSLVAAAAATGQQQQQQEETEVITLHQGEEKQQQQPQMLLVSSMHPSEPKRRKK